MPVPSVDHAHSPSPLAGSLDTDILRRRRRWFPTLVLGGQSVPDTDWIMQAQLCIVADMANMECLECPESVCHERRDPFRKRRTSFESRLDGSPEFPTVHVMPVGDVQGEQAECELPAEFGRIRREFPTSRRQGACRGGRREGEHSCGSYCVCVRVEFTYWCDLVSYKQSFSR